MDIFAVDRKIRGENITTLISDRSKKMVGWITGYSKHKGADQVLHGRHGHEKVKCKGT